MGFYQAQKIEALEARVAELEAKIYQCGLWEDMGPRQADAIVLLTTQVAQLQRSLACSIVNGNEAREQCLEHAYALADIRIAVTEACALAAESQTCCVQETDDYYSGYCDGVMEAAKAVRKTICSTS